MITQTAKSRLELRGIQYRDDPAYRRMLPWTKMAFVVGGTQAAIATFAHDAATLWQMVPVVALAVVLPHHPIEYIYNWGIRHIIKAAPLPTNAAPVRFAFFMAAIILASAAWAFDNGITWLGTFLGLQVALVAGTFVFSSFCIPAAIWAFVTGNKDKVCCALARA